MPERNWSTKTLYRQLAAYLRADSWGLEGASTIDTLLDRLKDSIVEEEVGVDLDIWGES